MGIRHVVIVTLCVLFSFYKQSVSAGPIARPHHKKSHDSHDKHSHDSCDSSSDDNHNTTPAPTPAPTPPPAPIGCGTVGSYFTYTNVSCYDLCGNDCSETDTLRINSSAEECEVAYFDAVGLDADGDYRYANAEGDDGWNTFAVGCNGEEFVPYIGMKTTPGPFGCNNELSTSQVEEIVKVCCCTSEPPPQ